MINHFMLVIVLAFAAAVAATPGAADYLVREVGSFHVGGRPETLSGLPTKDIVFSTGAPPIKVDPNGEFEVEQMYVQFVKLAQPKGAGAAAAVAWRRPLRRHLGDKTRRQARLAAVLPQCRLRRLRIGRGRARARVVGALSGNLQE